MTSELERSMWKAQLALRQAQNSAREAMTASLHAAKASVAAGRAVEALLAKALPAFHRDRAGAEPLAAAIEAASNAARMDRRETSATDPDPGPFDRAEAAGIVVGVKASRNVGHAKKAILTGAGLEWIGRDQWRGVTGQAGLAALQATFGEVRVTRVIAHDSPPDKSRVTTAPNEERGDPSPAGANPSVSDEEDGPPGVSPPDGGARRERTRLPPPLTAAPYPGKPLDLAARRSLDGIEDADLAAAIVLAVEVEGITDLDGIVERLRVPWRLKANQRFRDIIKAGLPLAADRLLATAGWEPGQDRVWYGVRDTDVTVWDRGEAHSEARRWQRLPPPEVALAAARCLGHLGSAPQADLVVTVTRVLGYESTSKSLNDVVVGVLDRLCTDGIVRRENGLITLKEQPATRITLGGWWTSLERAPDGDAGED